MPIVSHQQWSRLRLTEWRPLSNTGRYAEWVGGTLEVTRTDGPARTGSTYYEVNPILGPWRANSRPEMGA